MQARAYKYLFLGVPPTITLGAPHTTYQQAIINAIYDTFRVISPDKFVLVLPDTYNEDRIELNRVIQEMGRFVVVEEAGAERLQQQLRSP